MKVSNNQHDEMSCEQWIKYESGQRKRCLYGGGLGGILTFLILSEIVRLKAGDTWKLVNKKLIRSIGINTEKQPVTFWAVILFLSDRVWPLTYCILQLSK